MGKYVSAFFDSLSDDILGDSKFVNSFDALCRSAILASLSLPGEEKLPIILMKKLLESAAIFADSSVEHANVMAQRICASVLALSKNGGDVDFDDLIQIIQSKLCNFPAVAFLKKDLKAPKTAPIFIQMDYVAQRENHTITPTPERSFVLNDFQLSAWKNMGSGDPISLSAPTSAGKSSIVLLFLIHFLAENAECTIAYVVPTRALINQVSDDVRNAVLENKMQNVVVSSSPIRLSADQQKSRVVFVFTQERLDLFLNDDPTVKFDLVIIDEAQMIAGGARGVLLEAVIDRLKFANSCPRIFFAGPLISNPEYFAKIFSLEKLKIAKSTKSVTVQNMIYLNYREIPDRVIDVSIQTASGRDILYRHPVEMSLASETDRISYLAAKFGRNGSSLVYANGKADAEKIGVKICQAITEKSADVDALIKFVRKHIHGQYLLVETLPYGVAFHYGHMPALLRKELEDSFPSRKIGILVCTSTLCMG